LNVVSGVFWRVVPGAQWVKVWARHTEDDERCDAVGEREVFV
jgi:hypothetical protein